MSMAFGSKLQLQSGSWMEAVYDVYIGIVVGAGHGFHVGTKFGYDLTLRPLLSLLGFSDEYQVQEENTEGLKVVAVGYGRTGTVRESHRQRLESAAAGHRSFGS